VTNATAKIGVFDSGVGGLTVYRELIRKLPDEDFIYLGDTARVPYGIRSPETIRKYSLQNCLFLIEKGAGLIVVACNTATASALPFLQSILKVPVLGVVEPGASAALQASRDKKIGVIGTEATIRSKVYETALKSRDSGVSCFAKATPLLVPLTEEFLLKDEVLTPILDHYLKDFSLAGIDTLILGCTHYPIIKSAIDKYFAGKVRLVDSAEATADAVRAFLGRDAKHEPGTSKIVPHPLYVTDAPERVRFVAEAILGGEGLRIEKVEL
jgi:glutamate racemase